MSIREHIRPVYNLAQIAVLFEHPSRAFVARSCDSVCVPGSSFYESITGKILLARTGFTDPTADGGPEVTDSKVVTNG